MNIEAGMDVECVSDLKKYGVTEDGEDVIGLVYFTQITNSNGDRWNHIHRFPSISVRHGMDGPFYIDQNEKARERCEKLATQVRAASVLDMSYWEETRPVYGSNAYQQYGQFEDVQREKEEG